MDVNTLLSKAESKLQGVHPLLKEKARELIKRSHATGVNIIITQGLRTKEYQDGLYAQGRTKPGKIVTNVKYPNSYHCWGLAIDFAVVSSDGRTVIWDTSIDLDKDKHKDWYEVVEIAESLGWEAGARWKNFVDVPHLQWTFGLSINQLKAGKKPPTYTPPVASRSEEVKPTAIKKEEIIKEVIKLLSSKHFKDFTEDTKWAMASADRCFEREIVKGDGKGNLNPNGNMTRAELVVVADRIVEYLLKELGGK